MSLSELLKKRATINGVTKSSFKIPNIFGTKTSSAPTDTSTTPSLPTQPKFTKLSDLANAHLSSAKLTSNPPSLLRSNSINIMPTSNRPMFTLPKLKSDSPTSSSPVLSGERLTPHELSLQKIMELKRLHISGDVHNNHNHNVRTTYARCDTDDSTSSSPLPIEEQQFSVDLTSALIAPGEASQIISPRMHVAEPIDFKFVDCDIIEGSRSLPIVTKDCCLDISGIKAEVIGCRTKKTSSFGKILCSRYSRRFKPFVVHGFDNKHHIKPFGFEIIEIAAKKR